MYGSLKLASVKRSTPKMSAALPALPMSETVMVRLIRITVAGMSDYFEPVLQKIGLTEFSFHVLCLLISEEDGRASPSELSELVGTSRANMTRIIAQLEKEGLVRRQPDKRDARRYSVEITKAGRKLNADTVPMMIQPLKRAFSDLTEEEFKLLDKLLRKTILSFDKGAEEVDLQA